ncbi:unnamed protein product [Allacma fusca]|uniref:Uncharacterized protein n=3 Tax=Allacma fusca TaxID=39272 RepID=A0A8J2J3H2_9HEXA|nr:unnamed protein product [Allacma fusca]
MNFFAVLVALVAFGATAVSAGPFVNSSFKPHIIETFRNPIVDFISPDPQAIYHNGYYYLVISDNWEITIYKSAILTDFRGAQNHVAFRVPPGMANLWAPEIQFVRGNMYIYFAMDDGNNDNHRMYVIKADDPNNPMGSWGPSIRLYTEDPVDYWMIDGTPMEYHGQLYFIWSGWPDVGVGAPQNLYIALMCDPVRICGRRVLIREPKYRWEGPFTLEGPYVLQRADRTFVVFSAESTWGPDYCLGIMGIDRGDNPLDPLAWWHNNDGCVFSRNDAEGVFCTGHAGFTTSPDGTETWMIFHATNDVNDPGSRRVARIEKIEWDQNNHPIFPRPSGDSRDLRVPSGQIQETYGNPVLDEISADPGVIRLGDFYYLAISTNLEHDLTLLKSPYLTNFRNAERRVVYTTGSDFENLWASEIHLIQGQLYIYFTMNRRGDSHRMYVIKADDPNNPLGGWSPATRLLPGHETFTIDGTVLQYGNGRLYYIYSSVAQMFIAEMIDPMNVRDPGVVLRSPRSPWECGVNEGPFIVQNADRTFLIFSACSTWTPDYCLTMIGIDFLKDPMVPSNWWDDLDRCLFFKNPEEGIYTTGHATFTYSPDGTELWMIYHATNDPNSNESSIRVTRAQKMNWNRDKSPAFPRASGNGRQLAVPSGQPRQMIGSTAGTPE